jgi:hypothetical protein
VVIAEAGSFGHGKTLWASPIRVYLSTRAAHALIGFNKENFAYFRQSHRGFRCCDFSF